MLVCCMLRAIQISKHSAPQNFQFVEIRFREEWNRKAENRYIINEESKIKVLAIVEVYKTVCLRESTDMEYFNIIIYMLTINFL